MNSLVGSDATTQRPAWEVADVIRLHGEAFLATHGLNAEQRRTLYDLADCRTQALGGHVQRCLDCGHDRIAYNSCRNRHCPKCQALARARWLEREAKLLLPVEYHHVVFTLPAEVAELALANPALMYNALFQAASATLRDVAANPKRLGAQLGILMALHTWGQNLHHHPHVHAVVTGGGLSCNLRSNIDVSPQWRPCRPGFFLPVRVLSRVFRGKYLALLKTAFEQGKLAFPGRLAFLKDPDAFNAWLRPLSSKDWVVYAKPPFGGPAQVLKYLARYTHRVAISNSRIVDVKDSRVTFRYKDYADDHRSKTMTVSADEFLRRFVQHVLPRSFVKVRHYGLLANRHRAEKLKTCRRLLLPIAVVGTPPSTAAPIAPAAPPGCPKCGGCRLVRIELPKEPPRPLTPPPTATPSDTS
ncbi:putative transposase y4qJ [Verrucomicrobiota bacterium]|nr:putative transposase y4qJ [Verrucomicrobiota bacterium]